MHANYACADDLVHFQIVPFNPILLEKSRIIAAHDAVTMYFYFACKNEGSNHLYIHSHIQ